MKKKSIKHNSWVFIPLDQKSKYSLYFEHEEKNAGGSPTGLHDQYGIKKQDEKSIRIWGSKKYVDMRGELAKHADFYYDEDGNAKFKDYSIRLFSVENFKADVVGELTFMDEMKQTNIDTKEKYTNPPIVDISLLIPSKIYDIFEKKYLERDKTFFKSVRFEFGAFYDTKTKNKKQGRGIAEEPHIFQTFGLPITNYYIRM